MGSEKDTTQKKASPSQLGEGAEIKNSMSPPAQLFADGGGDGGGAKAGAGVLAGAIAQVGPIVAAAAEGKKAAVLDPPNKLVQASDRDAHKVSDAIVGNLNAVVASVSALTGADIGKGFGDTSRPLDFGTKKVGADNFSWHKSGRAIDFDQSLKWVIAKAPSGKEMFFRLYLEANEAGAKSAYAKTLTKDDVPNLHSNALGANVTKKTLVDVTAILEENGHVQSQDGINTLGRPTVRYTINPQIKKVAK